NGNVGGAAFDTSDGQPAFGETWGPANGSWLLRKGRAGFAICGIPDMNAGVVPVRRALGSSDSGSPAPEATKGTIDCVGANGRADTVSYDGVCNACTCGPYVWTITLPSILCDGFQIGSKTIALILNSSLSADDEQCVWDSGGYSVTVD